jgi:hypothetical protein
MTDASEALLGLSTGLLGVGILHACWRRWLAPRWLAVPAGWALVLLSPRFWVRFGGVELGTAYAALAPRGEERHLLGYQKEILLPAQAVGEPREVVVNEAVIHTFEVPEEPPRAA